MSSKIKFVLLSLTLLLVLGLAPALQAQSSLASNDVQDKIESQLLKDLETNSSVDFFLWLNDQANLSRMPQFADKTAKGEFVLDTLRQTADSSQQSIRALLDAQGVTYRPYYIANTILVQSGSRDLLLTLAARADVAYVYANHTFQLPEPIRSKNQPERVEGIESNLTFINADDVWAMGVTGENTVMAGNDTGLDWDHPAVINQYRGWNGATADHNYNWWDATGTYPTVPNDGHGHGTHTTGTMVGDDGSSNQIGVAPGAKTIHCKNMDNGGSGIDSWFLTCFEWDLAPWDLSGNNPDPSKAPDAINNSWGFWGGGNTVFQTAIANLHAAGILVEVSAGNEGPGCSTLRSPGDYSEVLTTGSVNHTSGSLPGDLTWFSSRGPSSLSGDFLPDIMAPGENIRSSLPGGGYDSWSGTSMAGPHATALIGLMWSANPGLKGLIPETIGIMAQTAVPLTNQSGSNCGGDYTTGPNHDWGYGTIDALAAVNAAMAYGDPGVLTGTATDAVSTNPIPGANITAALNQDLDWQRQTDNNGIYSMLLFSGTYTVTAELYGYYPQMVSGVQVVSFMTTTQNIALNPAPLYNVSGTVTDANTGWPLYASININGYPGGPVWTDPATGQYSIDLAAGIDYVFRVTPWVSGYQTAVTPVPALTGNQTEDFALVADTFACNAPGYQPQFVYFEDFESDDGGYTTEGFISWEWGTPTSGPNVAHSGSNVWATNLSGSYGNNESGYTQSPDIDLSAYAGQTIILSWWQWLQTEQYYDYAFVEVSNDGGGYWQTVYGWVDGNVSTNWQKQNIILDPSFAVSNFRVRFGFSSDGSVTQPGFYVDDVGIGVASLPPVIYSQDFEANDGSFVSAGTNNSWAWGVPTRGPSAAHSGSNVWATNLNDNYNNNEDSSITSPIIDLSSYTGQMVQLSWWHWLQTELTYDFVYVEISADAGANWDLFYGPASGVLGTDWEQLAFILDESYLTSDFQFRVRLESDGTVTYPGYYVDDLVLSIYTGEPPSVPCVQPTGGLVVGNVYDANTSAGLNGAAVVGDASNATTSRATPLDTAVDDGLYVLYSPAGSHTITASKAKYGDDVINVNVIAATAVTQDFSLTAGILSTNPGSLSATLNMGQSTTLNLSLDNTGGGVADFALRELNRGSMPTVHVTGAPVQHISGQFSPAWRDETTISSTASQGAGIASPPWTDIMPYPTAIFDNAAATHQGLVYSVNGIDQNYSITNAGFVYNPDTASWSPIAHMTRLRQKPSAAFVRDLLYVVGGWDEFGNPLPTLEIYDPGSDSWTLGADVPVPVAGAPAVVVAGQLYIVGGCLDGWCTPTSNVSRYDVDSDSWEAVAPYPEATAWNACGVLDETIYCAGGINEFGESNHTYSYDPGSDTWTRLADMIQTQWGSAFVGANGRLYISAGVTNNFSTITNETYAYDPLTDTWSQDANANTAVYRGASACGFYKIGGIDISGNSTSSTELYPDLTDCGADPNVPWLTMSPITGTIGAASSQTIQVTFDASVPEINQPGDYLAEIRVVDSTPYQMENVPVTLSVNAPASWGKVTGTVSGLARCDAPGAPLNRATVAIGTGVSLKTAVDGTYGYWLPNGSYTLAIAKDGYVAQTMSVSVSAGQTTIQNINLRPTTPCASGVQTGFNVTAAAGASTTANLTLNNLGAGDLHFNILETTFNLANALTLQTPAQAAGWYSAAASTGPLSAQSISGNGQNSSPLALESNWFGGADLPGGMIRYGHAQCAEDANSFYIISGVDGNYGISRSAWRYDGVNNIWQALAPIPAGQEGVTAVCYQGRIYAMGGAGSDQFFIYDIATNTWLAGAPLPRGVWGAAAAAWDGKIYLVGGDNDFYIGDTSNEVNIYNIATDTWTGTGSPMPVAAVTPGYVQAGPYLYVVGGWDDNSPATNVATAQRYNLSNDSWEIGPALAHPRADLALAMTNEALYAIGGDNEGGGFFDSTTQVERLDLSTWSAGSWSEDVDQLGTALTAVQAGFCTTGFFPAQVWAVGGMANFNITGGNRFLGRSDESCYSLYEDVAWLSESPVSSMVMADANGSVTLTFDATNLTIGTYNATLVITTNDSGAAQMRLPVTLTVTEAGPTNYQLFLPFISKNG